MTSLAFLPPTPLSAQSLNLAERLRLSHSLTPPKRARSCAITTPTARLSLPAKQAIITRAREDTAKLLGAAAGVSVTLATIATLSLPLPAEAAAGGGRMGGSSFRAPSRSIPRSRSYAPRAPSNAPSFYGPSFGLGIFPPMYISPFVSPIGFGGGFGTLFFLATAAAFAVNSVQRNAQDAEAEAEADPSTAVAVVKVALLASARELQVSLDRLAQRADTSTISGLRFVLAETATTLLRNPSYWTHGAASVAAPRLSSAEQAFETAALEERLKLDEETLVNARGVSSQAPRASARQQDLSNVPGEYIAVSIVVAASGPLVTKLPKQIDNVNDVERALRALASVSADNLQGVEVIWAPQSVRDVLTERELLADHPELKRV